MITRRSILKWIGIAVPAAVLSTYGGTPVFAKTMTLGEFESPSDETYIYVHTNNSLDVGDYFHINGSYDNEGGFYTVSRVDDGGFYYRRPVKPTK